MNAHSSKKVSFLIAATSIIFSAFLAEWVLRFFPEEKLDSRFYHFWSVPNLLEYPDKTIRYQASGKIRELGVYGDQVEFDYTYRTNNLGLIDDTDYPVNNSQSSRQFVLIGDSFTAGTGASPWVPLLRKTVQEKFSDIEVFNLGVCGTGVLHFKSLLEAISKKVEFSDIVILAICDDFYRPDWYPLQGPKGLHFCWGRNVSNAECLKGAVRIYKTDLGERQDKILKRVAILEEERLRFSAANNLESTLKRPQWRRLASDIINSSRVLKLLNAGRYAINRYLYNPAQTVRAQLYNDNLNALSEIAKTFPEKKLHFLHIPEEREVKNGDYLCKLEKKVKSIGAIYIPLLSACAVEDGWYNHRDGHFSKTGYNRLKMCVQDILLKEISPTL